MELWGRLGVTCWPTLLLLSPQGVPIHVTMGEGHQAFLTEYLHVAMQFFKGDAIFFGGGDSRFYAVFGSGSLWIRTSQRFWLAGSESRRAKCPTKIKKG
jgi:uncharacterized protein (AIM24 family)